MGDILQDSEGSLGMRVRGVWTQTKKASALHFAFDPFIHQTGDSLATLIRD